MLVSYHNLQLNNEPFVDGANLYSVENSKLITEFDGGYFKAQPHNIRDVLSGRESLSKLKSSDVVVSNMGGPYALAYHHIRDKKKLKFRIVRDVQTSFWQGYFLQEKLCGPYTREGDAVLFLSEFQRQLFIKLFPEHLNKENTFVCAPFMHFFPKRLPPKEVDYDGLTLGWVGRVTLEKGFHIALESFISLRKKLKNVRMIVAGGRTPPKLEEWILSMLKKNRIPNDAIIRLNNGRFIPHSSVWDAYRKLDIFLFPSVSHNESLGRVMIESAYCKLPVIAAHYAAAPEVLEKKNLIPVTYKKGLWQLASLATIGKVNQEDIVQKVLAHKKLSTISDISRYKKHDLKYANILIGNQKKENLSPLSSEMKRLIECVRLYQDTPLISLEASFDRLRTFIMKENYSILALWHVYTMAYMGYNPYILFFAHEDHDNFKRVRIKFQKWIMVAKNPVKMPFKKYYYFKRRRLANKRGY